MKKSTFGELIANAVSHGIGALFGIIALITMVIRSDSTRETIAGLAFGIALIFLYGSSTLYHSFPSSMIKTKSVFRRFDHSAIFVLITGTYTAFVLLTMDVFIGYLLLGILWTLTIIGIVLKSIWIKRFQIIHVVIYLAMGWSVVFIIGDVIGGLGNGFWLLLAGGISYTVGVGFYAMRFKYNHFIWHLFVLMGSVFHFIAIWNLM